MLFNVQSWAPAYTSFHLFVGKIFFQTQSRWAKWASLFWVSFILQRMKMRKRGHTLTQPTVSLYGEKNFVPQKTRESLFSSFSFWCVHFPVGLCRSHLHGYRVFSNLANQVNNLTGRYRTDGTEARLHQKPPIYRRMTLFGQQVSESERIPFVLFLFPWYRIKLSSFRLGRRSGSAPSPRVSWDRLRSHW